MTLTFAEIESWSAEEARERLSASDAEVAGIMKVAAEAGLAEAQALYGQILLDGKGIPRDEKEALRWFSSSAQAGHVMAMNMVGRCCEHGWGTPVDKVRAAQWYEAAAERGLDWGMYNLATLHCLGEGVPLDREAAFRLYSRAARAGHVKSINLLGGFHEDGWVVMRDMDVAADHYRRAAEGGDFRGEFNHARMLIEAGCIDEALVWLRKLEASATPAFLGKVSGWLAARPESELRAAAAEIRSQPA
ncbi:MULTISPECIES: tetratricopeptide repeat protein [unclassified Novosphingobium]|uniref:tetratricopeptide repeat protein n=1 Tax=unclassified Novosphingobium TaxID=2644732 RepID=UPI001357F562|nr:MULTISPECIES: tetratricopeptide repeat protein [unclassified Novosphingobium]